MEDCYSILRNINYTLFRNTCVKEIQTAKCVVDDYRNLISAIRSNITQASVILKIEQEDTWGGFFKTIDPCKEVLDTPFKLRVGRCRQAADAIIKDACTRCGPATQATTATTTYGCDLPVNIADAKRWTSVCDERTLEQVGRYQHSRFIPHASGQRLCWSETQET